MSHIKKKYQFQKVLEDYDFMKNQLERNGEKLSCDETVLFLNAEKLNFQECERIFFMLRHTLTLQTIILKSNVNQNIVNEVVKLQDAEKYKDGPIFFTKYALRTTYQAITDYLYNSDRIKILAFKNIPITNDLPILCQGIRSNRSIRVLNFEDCDICDDGCIQICQALRKSPIESLGLENCKINLTGASWLAWLIREQSMLRTLTTWNKYQNENEYKTEQGIRKLAINDNPGIKDTGAKFIIGTLFDDNWVTHIHMQNTGLSDVTGALIIRLLRQNKSITIFNLGRNYATSRCMVERIGEVLAKTLTEASIIPIQPKSNRKQSIIKKKNSRKKKRSIDKLLFDKSQQTSEYSLYCQPFLLVDPNQKHKISSNKYIINSYYNDSSCNPLPSVIPKQFDPVSEIDNYSQRQSFKLKKKRQMKNTENRKKIDYSYPIGKKENRKKTTISQPSTFSYMYDWQEESKDFSSSNAKGLVL
ncbi:protein Cep78 homolog [Halyomorpha halys]|uniref:protein Cep78 homolog n=1 Tax=Halyomorpha halys TaxID=286706 RepID=UPI000D0C93F8|nr:uncharacterized protein LOC112210215 [Halyomorpha halys]